MFSDVICSQSRYLSKVYGIADEARYKNFNGALMVRPPSLSLPFFLHAFFQEQSPVPVHENNVASTATLSCLEATSSGRLVCWR